MNSKWYQITIKRNDESTHDYMKTLRDAVRFIASETGMSQREVRSEISANTDSSFNRDNLGFRVYVTYTNS